MRIFRAAGTAALLAFAAGCISHREHPRVYVLAAAPDGPGNAVRATPGHALQLQRVLIPDYLDTTDLILRVGTNEVRESATGRFGERLSLGITHALRSDLAARLPMDIIGFAQPADKSARQILVNVDVFDVWQDGRCVLDANWSILGPGHGVVLAADRAVLIAPASADHASDAAIVLAIADTIRQLADRIATTVQSPP